MGQDKFSNRLLHWYDRFGRHDLPWQDNPTPYRVWVSEIMLQQTQVATVIPYFQRFMERFPDLPALAHSPLDDILHHWSGLGYYARARNLHRAAQRVVVQHAGSFPDSFETIQALPGIGRSTAGAILSLAFNQRRAILDGNVRRVLCRYHAIDRYPGEKQTETELWQLAEQHTPHRRYRDYTQAIMDLGATLCTRSQPQCERCPQVRQCRARQRDEVGLYPRPKPKRQRPLKHCYMLAMIDPDQRVALFQRPPSGIWGGLYSLPEFSSRQTLREQLAGYRLDAGELLEGDELRHAFSHFELRITPLMLPLTEQVLNGLLNPCTEAVQLHDMSVNMAQNTLYPLAAGERPVRVGIPTPVQKILDQFSATR